jgi:hypothetical protein
MNRLSLLAPLIILMVLTGTVAAAYAIDWTSPSYAFYGADGTGPIYFSVSFESTNGTWTGGLIVFSHFNMGGAGDFGTIGFAGELGLSTTIREIVPDDHILMQTVAATTKNFTIYLPTEYVMNVTNSAAWTWNNSSKMLKLTAPAGTAQIQVDFTESSDTPTVFYVPQWFVDQGGSFFGIAGFFTEIQKVMTAFTTFFLTSVANIVSLITVIMMSVIFYTTSVLYWFVKMAAFFISLITIIGDFLNGTRVIDSSIGNVWVFLNFNAWVDFVPVMVFILWWSGLPGRSKKTGRGWGELIISDLQTVMYLVDLAWNWSWTIFNFVYGFVMQFVGLVWSLV